MRPSSRAVWAGGALLALLFLLNVYRAATQSIVHDEALTYQHYLSGPLGPIFTTYWTNNHVLHTILCRITVSALGLSEISMRLPSLLGGLLYFAVVFRLCRYVFASSTWFLAGVALLSLNPFLLDFLSAARGYGMAIAFFMLALYQALQYMVEGRRDTLRYSGIAMALSVAANLTLLYACAGLTMALLFSLWKRGRLGRELLPFAVPAILIDAALLALPLSHAHRDGFNIGVGSLSESFTTLIFYSLLHNQNSAWVAWYFWTIRGILAALVILILIAAPLLAWRARGDAKERANGGAKAAGSLLAMLAAINWVGLALLLAGHYGLHLPYPIDRTGLYWIPLLELSGLQVAFLLPHRATRMVAGLLLGAILLRFAGQLDTSWYAVWQYDSGTKHAVEAIRGTSSQTAHPPVRLGATWMLEPSLNFYRDRYRLPWILPVTRDGPEGAFDYYLLLPQDHRLLARYELRPIFEDRVAGLVLARPGR